MESFVASQLPGRSAAVALGEVYAARLEPAEIAPADPDDFDAELKLGQLGPLRLARLACRGGGTVTRSARHAGHAAGRTYAVLLQVRASSVLAHYGHEARLEEGDLALCDAAAPYVLRLAAGAEVVMLRAAPALLKGHLPSPELFCGRRVPAAQGVTCAVAAATMSLCSQLEAPLSAEFQDRFARHLLDMIATSYAVAFDQVVSASAITSGRHARVKLHIEQHLRDPELSPRAIAEGLRLSSRYLRMIFASSGETVSAYILRRRLEECARQIADPRWRGHSITEIAFAWGFNSAPHFTRSFRERFGASPRSYRRTQIDGAPLDAAA